VRVLLWHCLGPSRPSLMPSPMFWTLSTALVAACILHTLRRRRRSPRGGALIFTGTGCSSGLPLVGCTLGVPVPGCEACKVAIRRGAVDPNWRGNVSALIRFVDATDGRVKHIQIDCGKTFRETTALRVYRQHGVRSLDALILTHDHADAVGGLDELRSLQPFDPVTFEIGAPIRCFCDRRTLHRLKGMFPYLLGVKKGVQSFCRGCAIDLEPADAPRQPPPQPPPPTALGNPTAEAAAAAPEGAKEEEGKTPVRRFVAKLEWETFGGGSGALQQASVFQCCGLQVHALPVLHGADYTCFGFGFGPEGARVVYLSDYTALLPPTEEILSRWSSAPDGIELLVLDALRMTDPHPVHATAEESIELARRLRPRRCLLVGMSHSMEHASCNRKLRRLWAEEGLDVQLAYDGQCVPLQL
jgi:phosphoribosyl 1,2-cyclic phosphodiesterase